jgi:hypothetical protein
MEIMLIQFQRILLEEIITMMRRQEPAHRAYYPSVQRSLPVTSADSDAWDIGLPPRLQTEEASRP